MVARHRHRRLLTTGAGWVTPGQFGEIQVNPVRRRLAIVDADGSVVEPIGIPTYDARSKYAVGDFVVRSATILRCTTAIDPPEAFNAAHWVEVGKSQADLETYFDTQYADIAHLHTGVYSPVGHNHDASYAAIGHNHDASYASITHNHDATYGRLANSNTWTATNTFADVVNLAGSYAAVYGSLSVAGGSGGFVPASVVHVRANTTTNVLIEATGSDQQARVELKNSLRDWIVYTQGGLLRVFDQTAGAERLNILTDGTTNVAQNFRVGGSLLLAAGAIRANNDTTFGLSAASNQRRLDFSSFAVWYADMGTGVLSWFWSGANRFQLGPSGEASLPGVGVNLWNAAGHLGTRGYTFGTLPSAAAHGGSIVFVVDAGPGYCIGWSNGTNWLVPGTILVT